MENLHIEPFIVEFTLVTGRMIPNQVAHFDSLLAWCAVQEGYNLKLPNPIAEQENLPLAKVHGTNGEWCWRASALHGVRNGGTQPVHYYRPYQLRDIAEAKDKYWTGKKIDVLLMGTGSMKSFALIDAQAFTPSVVAVGYGDIQAIEKLLKKHITHIGRQHRNGYGEVKKIEVRKATEEQAQFWNRRTLPQSLENYRSEDHREGVSPLHPPYWDTTKAVKAFELPANATVVDLLLKSIDAEVQCVPHS